jgi:hypothetical protein
LVNGAPNGRGKRKLALTQKTECSLTLLWACWFAANFTGLVPKLLDDVRTLSGLTRRNSAEVSGDVDRRVSLDSAVRRDPLAPLWRKYRFPGKPVGVGGEHGNAGA